MNSGQIKKYFMTFETGTHAKQLDICGPYVFIQIGISVSVFCSKTKTANGSLIVNYFSLCVTKN